MESTQLGAEANPGKRRRLVVVVPGITGLNRHWTRLRERLSTEPEISGTESVWLEFDHGVRLFTFGRLELSSRRLRTLIEGKWFEHKGFDDIVLVGHSVGGLIVRQAYVMAIGAQPGEPASDWGKAVSRIVLFASVNRGFDPRRIFWGIPIWLLRSLPTRHLTFLQMTRGSDYLTALRINWIRGLAALAEAAPQVAQILGDRDSVVDADDSVDVLALPQAQHVHIPGARHGNVYRLDSTPDPEMHYSLITRAFFHTTPADPQAPPAIKKVVFLLHGIRASGVDDWIQKLAQEIQTQGPTNTLILRPDYGYFTALRFALPRVRKKNIKIFHDWYTEILALHPTAEFDIVAHSNGTYILGHSLKTIRGMKFDNVILAGSVLPTDFPWDDLKRNGQVRRVWNARANRDWPVALLCNGLRGWFQRDVGTGGFAGFRGYSTIETAYYPGGHGAPLEAMYHKDHVAFIFGNTPPAPQGLVSSPGLFRQISNLMPFVMFFGLLSAILSTGALLVSGNVGIEQLGIALLIVVAVYVFLEVI